MLSRKRTCNTCKIINPRVQAKSPDTKLHGSIERMSDVIRHENGQTQRCAQRLHTELEVGVEYDIHD